jgi:hypothetical protein
MLPGAPAGAQYLASEGESEPWRLGKGAASACYPLPK